VHREPLYTSLENAPGVTAFAIKQNGFILIQLTDLSLDARRRSNYFGAMRYFFHIFDRSKFSPDDAGNNLPSLEYAKRMAVVVADELKKDDGFCRSSLVIVSDENGKKLFEYGSS
jgi:hypothetical protein